MGLMSLHFHDREIENRIKEREKFYQSCQFTLCVCAWQKV